MHSPFFCDNCRSLSPADGLNYFELLGLAAAFDLDPARLRQSYLQASRRVHPDQHGADADADSELSLRLSAQLNEAHRVLADPVLRAEYLLELLGGKSAKRDKSVPPAVLSATLALQEEIQDAKAANNATALDACRNQVQQRCTATLAAIEGLARRLPGDDALRRELRQTLNSIKYYQRLREQVSA